MCHLAQSPRSWGQGCVPRPGGSEVLAGVPLAIMSAWHWANCLRSRWPNSSGVKWGLCSFLCQSWLLWLLTPLRKPTSAAVFQELIERKDLTSSGVFWHLHDIIIKLLVIFSACALLNYFFFLNIHQAIHKGRFLNGPYEYNDPSVWKVSPGLL